MMDAPHGGDIYAYDRDLLDFSVNLNPLGMPDRVLRAIREHARSTTGIRIPIAARCAGLCRSGSRHRKNGWCLAMERRISLSACVWF